MVGIFARIVNYDMRNDEQLYAPPAILLDENRLYADIFYNHVPGSAWVFDAAEDVTGSDRLLLTTRMVVFAFWLAFGVIVFWSTWALTRSPPVSALLVILMLTNQYLLGPTGVIATNNFLPLPFAYLALTLFILGVEQTQGGGPRRAMPATLLVFGAGLCLSIAATMKLNAATFIIIAVIAAFTAGKFTSLKTRVQQVIAPLALGGVLGAAPLLMVALRNYDSFFAHVISYNTQPHRAYWAQAISSDPNVAVSMFGKAILSHQILFSGANLLLFTGVMVLLIAQATKTKSFRFFKNWNWPVYMAAGAAALSLFAAFLPTPSFPQYFAQPIITVPLFLAVAYRTLEPELRTFFNHAAMALTLVALAAGAPRIVQDLPSLRAPASWTVNKVHRDGVAIANELRRRDIDGMVATLFPVYPLEGGLKVYPELATGPFAYRTGDLADAKLLQHYVTTSPSSIGERLRAEPPAAILVGFAPALEEPIYNFAVENRYEKADIAIKSRYGEGILYVRPKPSD